MIHPPSVRLGEARAQLSLVIPPSTCRTATPKKEGCTERDHLASSGLEPEGCSLARISNPQAIGGVSVIRPRPLASAGSDEAADAWERRREEERAVGTNILLIGGRCTPDKRTAS